MLRTVNLTSNPYYYLQSVRAGARVVGPGAIVFTRNQHLELHVRMTGTEDGRVLMTYQLVDNGYHLYAHSITARTVRVLMDMLPGLVDRQLSLD
ncbi:hypothetical protein Vid5_gp83 [Pantoea phage vB_PagS_Vid5]|uniref:Uncharacterized protein n=1 Tax=Pantoea phage vB_PagS_Vid5 TaxID=2099652 RepID=A0A2P1CKX9_9CAUD|nr:hypothetical protein FDJ45_gp072 [Pantoea phage vB_PagS_Vid5]AVJ51838.1 hypothetical protein Vid5_gp83 [Pantoea phage vB_PagS_Vid5]